MPEHTPGACDCYVWGHQEIHYCPTHAVAFEMARALAAAQKAIQELPGITDEHEAERQQLAAQNAALLAALENLLVWADWKQAKFPSVYMNEPNTGARDEARAAIAQATGGSDE